MPVSTLAVICAAELAAASTVVFRLQPAPFAFGIPMPRPTVTDVPRLVSVTLAVPACDALKACDVAPLTVNTLENVSVVGDVVAGGVVVDVDGDVGLLEHPPPNDAKTKAPMRSAAVGFKAFITNPFDSK